MKRIVYRISVLISVVASFYISGLYGYAEIEQTIRVRVLQIKHLSALTLNAQKASVLFSDAQESTNLSLSVSAQKGKIIYSRNNKIQSSETLRVKADTISVFYIENKKKEERIYPGAVELYADNDELVIINEAPLDLYSHSAALSELGELSAVKGSDPSKSWRNELVSAMEICIRSFSLAEKNRHNDSRYQFCDLTHCVHYTGSVKDAPLTYGKILIMKGKILTGYFHSTCGGILSSPEVLWRGSAAKGYRIGDDTYEGAALCEKSPHYRWSYLLGVKDAEQISGTTDISNITVDTAQGRVRDMVFRSPHGDKVISASVFLSNAGKKLGWNKIKSNCFTIQKISRGFLITGKGLGHGTGLCQYGAATCAKKGWSYEKILSFYFPGTEIGVIK